MREHALELSALTVCPETEVIDIEVTAGRVARVVTDRGGIETESVVVACGVWSARIAAMAGAALPLTPAVHQMIEDRKSTRLNSSHVAISYAVFCLKKKIIQGA